jgi:hypothetical protein
MRLSNMRACAAPEAGVERVVGADIAAAEAACILDGVSPMMLAGIEDVSNSWGIAYAVVESCPLAPKDRLPLSLFAAS